MTGTTIIHRWRLLAVLAAGLTSAAGCSSGIVGHYCLSADGQVIAYEDAAWGVLSVSDGSRPRLARVPAFPGAFVLSDDGNYLLVARERCLDVDNHPPRYGFYLRDTHSRRHWHLPPPVTDGNSLSGLKVYFQPGPVLTLAWPDRDTDEAAPYRRWSAEAGWQATDHLPAGDGRYFADKGRVGDEHPFVFLPAAGWIARRTVWVTPAGDTVELLRQNDVPAYMLVGGLLSKREVIPCDTTPLLALRPEEDVTDLTANSQARLDALIQQRKASAPSPEEASTPVISPETQPAGGDDEPPADE